MLKESKEVLAKAAEEMGYNFEKTYHGCSQAVARAVLHALGRQEETLFAASFPFAGGLAMTQGTCGAVVGGMMCLGACSKKYGRPWDEFNTWGMDQLFTALNSVAAVYERCKETLGGTVNCREIVGFDMKDKEEVAKFSESEKFEACCRNCGKIARIIVEALLEEG